MASQPTDVDKYVNKVLNSLQLSINLVFVNASFVRLSFFNFFISNFLAISSCPGKEIFLQV